MGCFAKCSFFISDEVFSLLCLFLIEVFLFFYYSDSLFYVAKKMDFHRDWEFPGDFFQKKTLLPVQKGLSLFIILTSSMLRD